MNGQRRSNIYINTHTMEYYAAEKRDENLPFATAQMDLEGVAKSLSHVRLFERVFAK